MEDPKIILERAKMRFVEECKECYVHPKFMRCSKEGLPIPNICLNCVDRKRYEDTVLAVELIMGVKRGRGFRL